MNYEEQWNRNRVDWLYQLARCEEVSAAAVRVGLLFATFLQPDSREEVKPSFAWLAENAHMSGATLAKALRELEDAGFIEVVRFHATANYYRMPFDGVSKWERKRIKPYEPKERKGWGGPRKR